LNQHLKFLMAAKTQPSSKRQPARRRRIGYGQFDQE